tara:strand:- start:179 stop:691 length:513 start_codon:yes stop_codon:yes gene_type:complete
MICCIDLLHQERLETMHSAEEALGDLGIDLPDPIAPKGVYRNVLVSGSMLTTSGHLPATPQGDFIIGKLGDQLDADAGFAAARLAGLGILASLREAIGSLDRVVRVVKVLGFVNCTPEFTAQPAVINGCSELFREIFGEEHGVGTRSAVGASSLPLGVAVELEAVFEIRA